MRHLFFEKTVNSFEKLIEELRLLDLDSGVRAFANYEGKKGEFVFITRSTHERYTMMVYEKRKRGTRQVPGKRLLVRQFQNVEDLGRFIQSILSRPVRAFIY